MSVADDLLRLAGDAFILGTDPSGSAVALSSDRGAFRLQDPDGRKKFVDVLTETFVCEHGRLPGTREVRQVVDHLAHLARNGSVLADLPDLVDDSEESADEWDPASQWDPWACALYMDERAPFAYSAAEDALYRYSPRRGSFRRVSSIGVHLALIRQSLYDDRNARDLLATAKAIAVTNGRRLDGRAPSPLIPLANGVLDPRSGELMAPSPDHLLLGTWDVEWIPGATCPRIMAYLEHHFPGQVDPLLDTAARLLDRVNPQDRVLFIFGKPRSGKSTVIRLLEALVGPEARSSESLQALARERWAVAQLHGKALNTVADLSSQDVAETATFKALTGGDSVAGEFKFAQKFSFRSHALQVYSANAVPALPSDSEAELARFVPVYAGRSFLGEEDPSIEAELMTELPGLLVELVGRFQKRAKPVPLPVVVDQFRRNADRVARFAEECLEPLALEAAMRSGTEASLVYERFRSWAEKNGFAAIGRNRFYERLRTRGIPVSRSNGLRVGAALLGHGDEVDSETSFRAWSESVYGN